MKVKVSFTVDVDYEAWKAIREQAGQSRQDKASKADCRDNVISLAEEAFENTMDDYVPFTWIA